jgi:hypothetical protein
MQCMKPYLYSLFSLKVDRVIDLREISPLRGSSLQSSSGASDCAREAQTGTGEDSEPEST